MVRTQVAKVEGRTDTLLSEYTRGWSKKVEKKYIEKPNCDFKCEPGKAFECCWDCVRLIERVWADDREFRLREYTEHDILLLKKIFDKKTGYLTEFGCALPRHLRPWRCLTYWCGHARKRSKL